MKLHVGTSGYSYKEWKGTFYPEKMPTAQMLHFYGEHFKTVEINNTFYKMPKAAVLEAWAEQVPADFQFALKAPQRITHMKRLKDAGEPLLYFLEASMALKERLGPLLFQLPPNLKKDAPRLRDFLALLPANRRAAFEFRHESWFDEETLGVLRDHRVALCLAEADDELKVPIEATADWGILRLRKAEYDDDALKAWLKRLETLGWQDAFVFFKHEDEGTGPKFANRLLELAK